MKNQPGFQWQIYEPGSKLLVLGMVIQPLTGNPYNGYINPYYWVDDHPLLYGNNGSFDPGTYKGLCIGIPEPTNVSCHPGGDEVFASSGVDFRA